MGELIEQIPSATGKHLPNVKTEGDHSLGRSEAAFAAGLSEHQQVQAVRRAGELLERIESATGQNNQYAQVKTEGDHSLQSRTEVARSAGLSEHQQVQAVLAARGITGTDRAAKRSSTKAIPS